MNMGPCQGVTVDSNRNVFVIDQGMNNGGSWTSGDVWRWNNDGSGTWSYSTVSSNLNDPHGITRDSGNNIWIADTGNNRVVKLNNGLWSQQTVVSGLHQPQGIGIDGTGNIWVADTGASKVLEYSNGGTLLTSFSSPAPGGVAVDLHGNVWVSDQSYPSRLLEYKQTLSGDANLDGKVDINDLTIVLANYNASGLGWSLGDFNGDTKVDINDLTIVLASYNQTLSASPGALSTVPEPGMLMLIAAGLGGLFFGAWWRRKRPGPGHR